jgi:hypothetical protein
MPVAEASKASAAGERRLEEELATLAAVVLVSLCEGILYLAFGISSGWERVQQQRFWHWNDQDQDLEVSHSHIIYKAT